MPIKETIDAGKIAEETQALETYWADRNKQMEIDRSLIHLVKPIPVAGKIQWKTNEPKVFYDTATALLSSQPPRFRMPLTINPEPEEKEKMNKSERFVLGIFRELDARQMVRGQSYWQRELAYWILSGWYSIFKLVHRNNGEVEFIADIWDPMTVYPEWTADRLTKCVRTYTVDKRTAMTMAMDFHERGLKFQMEEPKDTTLVKVINYWLDDRDKIYNAIMMGSTVIKNLTKEKFDRIPISVGAVGVPDRISPGWQIRYGENIIAPSRDMFEYEEFMLSLLATVMAETTYPNIISKTQQGRPITQGGMKGYGEEIALKLNESVDVLKHATTPQELNILLGWVTKQRQKATFSEAVYGGMPGFEISGFALSQFLASIKYRVNPYLITMQHCIADVASDLMRQYKNGKFPSITLSTTNPKSMQKGLFFVESFSRKDVPESRYIEVIIPITSQIDKTQQIIYARQALAEPQVLSMETIWDEILDVQDSEQEYARIINDRMLRDPFVMDVAIVEEMKKREQFLKNQGKVDAAAALAKYIAQKELQLGMRTGGPSPKSPEGVSPEMMPPEMGKSPDLVRAALGVPPSRPTSLPRPPGGA